MDERIPIGIPSPPGFSTKWNAYCRACNDQAARNETTVEPFWDRYFGWGTRSVSGVGNDHDARVRAFGIGWAEGVKRGEEHASEKERLAI